MLEDFKNQLQQKTDDMMTVSKILRQSSVEREIASKELHNITYEEEKDRIQIEKEIEEIHQKIEREKQIKYFINKKLKL
jgi:uncharacterized protein (DUF3084 family)